MSDEKKPENTPVIGEFKGNPVITLNPNSRYPFTFGLSKAKLIIENLDAINNFITTYEKSE